MIKLLSILFLILLHHNYANLQGDDDNRYEALMRLKEHRAPVLKTFPFADIKSLNDESIVDKYLCPAETDEDVSNMEIASKHNYTLKYCLFKKNFEKNQDRICEKEPKPVLLEMTNTDINYNVAICGSIEHHMMYSLSYYDCGDASVMEEFRDEITRNNPKSYKLPHHGYKYSHQICYNTVKKSVAWTIHCILSPQLFQNPYFQNQPEPLETEISTDSYFMDANLFLILKKKYELEKLKDTSEPGTFVMVPRPLIPPEHYALPMYKKSTNHYLNMAPLWEKLVPLMTAIDHGIKQAQINLELRNPDTYNDIVIHTRVTTPKDVDDTSKTRFNLVLFRGNIWYKFVYQRKARSAVMIIIHNTPGNPPSNNDGCLVGKKKECDFRKWLNDKEGGDTITSDALQYAYCCKVEPFEVTKIFYYSYEINEYFNIESLITNGPNSKL